MNAIAQNLEKLKDYIFILLVTGFYTMFANTFGYNGDIAQWHSHYCGHCLFWCCDSDAPGL